MWAGGAGRRAAAIRGRAYLAARLGVGTVEPPLAEGQPPRLLRAEMVGAGFPLPPPLRTPSLEGERESVFAGGLEPDEPFVFGRRARRAEARPQTLERGPQP